MLQSRIHETWARFFSSTLEDRLRYAPSDCFRTFPFPEGFESDTALEAAREAYHTFRADLMIDRNEGLTKIYNRFHARGENAPDIARLRRTALATIKSNTGWTSVGDPLITRSISSMRSAVPAPRSVRGAQLDLALEAGIGILEPVRPLNWSASSSSSSPVLIEMRWPRSPPPIRCAPARSTWIGTNAAGQEKPG
jgi:hypothetical protein